MTKLMLSTKAMLNWLKLVVVFPCILFTAIVITAFELYGIEYILLALFLVAVLWFYRVTYSASNEVGDLFVEVKVKLNFFGVKFITIKSNGIHLISNQAIKGDEFAFYNDKNCLSFKLKFLKGEAFLPCCTIAVQ